MALLELDGVSRAFGGLQAVAGVSLRVPAGEITGLIGPNGAGKTTVVNLATGLLALSGGRVMLDGRDLSRLAPHAVAASGVARTFQNIRLLPEASVRDNIRAGFHRRDQVGFVAKLTGWRSVRQQDRVFAGEIDGLLAAFGLRDQADRLAGELAYGHQRRVEIMRALATAPGVLLLDEPAAGMNDSEAQALGVQLRRLAAEGLAVLLIEHNMRLMMRLCDTLTVLATGKVIAQGRPEAVRRDAAVVAAYLGG